MNSLKTYLLLILSFVVVAEQGCRSKSALDGRGMPSHLILAVSTAGDNTGTIQSAFAPLKTYLEKKLNMGVEIIYTNDYTSVIEAIKAKKVHVAYLAPF